MRQLVTLLTEGECQVLADYLLTLGIPTRIDPDEPAGFAVWVRDDDHLERARQELELYRRDPTHERYQAARRLANHLRRQADQAERLYRRNMIDARALWYLPAPGSCPLTFLLIGLSVLVSLATRLGAPDSPLLYALTFSPYEHGAADDDRFGDEAPPHSLGLAGLERGQVWRLVTPIFLHFGALHLGFNMLWLFDLGGRIEAARGTWRLLALVLVSAVVGNCAQYFWHEFWRNPRFPDYGVFGGMSGVVFALFGYVWMKRRFDPGSGLYLPSQTVTVVLIYLVICMTGVLGSIGNAAHVGGLAVGVAAGSARPLWRRLRRRR
jgi:GlpG protein